MKKTAARLVRINGTINGTISVGPAAHHSRLTKRLLAMMVSTVFPPNFRRIR
jgi:hypothetical protein